MRNFSINTRILFGLGLMAFLSLGAIFWGAESGNGKQLLLISGLFLALGLPLCFFISRSITAPLRQTMQAVDSIARGNFDISLAVQGKDEISSLQQSLNSLGQALQNERAEITARLAETEEQANQALAARYDAETGARQEQDRYQNLLEMAGRLEVLLEELRGSVEEATALGEKACQEDEEQRKQVQSTSTAMEEMNSSVVGIARKASNAAAESKKASKQAVVGENVVEMAMQSISATVQEIESLKTNMGKLEQEAQGIGVVMNVINEIADQTNLLALNAAIEAARAGEAGRGFAVVADEVRKLAEKTMGATQEVENSVSSMRQVTKNNMDSMADVFEKIGQASQYSTQSGSALKEIVRASESSSDLIHSIASDAERQAATSDAINNSIEELNQLLSENSARLNDSVHILHDFSARMQAVRSLVLEIQGKPPLIETFAGKSVRRATSQKTKGTVGAEKKKISSVRFPIEWSDDFATTVHCVDEQHKKLVFMVNDLHKAMTAGKGNEALADVLTGLKEYVIQHFGDEEKWQQQAGYPGFLHHKKIHTQFVAKLVDLESNFKEGRVGISMELMDFLKDWLLQHIMGTDQKYVPYLKAKGID